MYALMAANFQMGFKDDLILFESFIFFTLLTFWIYAFWESLFSKTLTERNEGLWVIISLALGLSLGGFASFQWGSHFFLFALCIGFSIGMAMIHTGVAACFLTALLFLRPWELVNVGTDDYIGLLPRLSFIICLSQILIKFAAKKRLAFNWNASTHWIIAFAVWCYISTFANSDPISAQLMYSEIFFKSIFLYFVLINSIENKRDLRALVITVLIVFLGLGLISVYQTLAELGYRDPNEETRLEGLGALANSNDIAALMVMVYPMALIRLLDKNEKTLIRIGSTFLIFLMIFTIYLAGSRGSFLAFGIATMAFGLLKMKSKKSLRLVIPLTLALIPLANMSMGSRTSADLEGSTNSRKTYIIAGAWMGIKRPIFGVGFDGYAYSLSKYATGPLEEADAMTAHNSWILVFAENGLIGFILFVGIYVSSLKMSWQIKGTDPEYLLALISYGIAITFLSHSYGIYLYLLYAIVAAAKHSSDREYAKISA